MIPIGINAQFLPDLGLEVGYDPETNTVYGSYEEKCDFCWLGFNSEARNTCLCREDCDAESISSFQNCFENCQYIGCVVDCEERRLRDLTHCLNICGPEPETVHIRRNIEFQLIAAWNTIPFHPFDNEVNWEIYAPPQQVINDGVLGTVSFQPDFPWPDIHFGFTNVCYGFRVRIFYQVAGTGGSSGTDAEIFFCQDEVWDCQIRG